MKGSVRFSPCPPGSAKGTASVSGRQAFQGTRGDLFHFAFTAVRDKDSQRTAAWPVVVEMTEGLALLHFRREDPGELLQGRLWGPGSAQGPFKLIKEQAPSRV